LPAEATITSIESWIEKLAKEALTYARKNGVTHSDAVDHVAKDLASSQKIKIINKALDIFLREKAEQGMAQSGRRKLV